MRKSIKFNVFISIAALLFLISCRKDLLFDKLENVSISEKFFAHSGKTEKIILSVIDEIRNRNNKREFVSNFAIKNGLPIWDKPIISYPVAKSNFSNSFSQSNIEEPAATDTFVYVPIVLEDGDKVNGFILAKINNGVELLYSLAKDYKAFSFENGVDLNDASKFVVMNLLLNKEVFGVSNYKITDYNLFTGDNETDKANSLSIEGRLAASECAIISWQSQYCGTPNYPGCRSECDNCGTYCYPISSSVEICIAPNTVTWPAGGIGISAGGSGSGESGGGGGGDIPHYYPCISTPQSVQPGDPLPPCPEPGPGSGWIPVTEIVPDLNIIGDFLDDPNIGEADPTVISFDYYQNPWPTISNVISTSQFVGYDFRNCLTLAKDQIAVAGVQDLGYASAYKIFDAQGGPYPNIAKLGVDYIITKLLLRIPVIIGVDNRAGSPSQQNADGMTDHFVTIIGSGQDIRGKYFTFFDNSTNNVLTGTSPSNKLYYYDATGIISGHSATTYAQSTTYIVTQIRKNN